MWRLHQLKNLLTNDVDLEDNLENLGDPVSEEDDGKTKEGASDSFLTFFLSFFVGGTSQHGKAARNEHAKQDYARERKERREDGADDAPEIASIYLSAPKA